MKPRAGLCGGLEKYTHFLMDAFLERKCDVTLLTTGFHPKLEKINIVSLAPDSKYSLYELVHFNKLCQQWLKKHPHDVIFGMERTTAQTHYRAGNGVHATYLKRRKMVEPLLKTWTFACNPLHRMLLKMEREAYESSSLKVLFANSKMVRDEILTHYNTPQELIEVVHNGVEWEKWGSHFEQSAFNRQDPFQFLFVGNGYKRKGLDFLLQGLERLKERDFQLTVIGKDKQAQTFIDKARTKGLERKVRFLGPQKEITPFYQAADALILPSIYDPFANVTVEALAMGLFVVTSRFNGGCEVIQNDTGNIIEDMTSPESMESSLKKALDRPKTEAHARHIRESIKGLDFSIQLAKIVKKTLLI